MYDLHLEAYVRQLIPIHRRLPKNVSLVRTLLKPIGTLFELFANYRRAATLASTSTGQIAVLEYNCNRIAGLPSGHIYITDSVNKDFAVLVPPSVSLLIREQISVHIERYKLAGKTFEIVINN